MTIIIVLFLAGLIGSQLLAMLGERNSHTADSAWDAAFENESGQVGRILLGVARPVAGLGPIQRAAQSPQYAALHRKLKAAGGLFGSSVEVFLAVQAVCAFISAMVCILLLSSNSGKTGLILGVVFALAFAGYPYNQVSTKVKARAREVGRELPDFAELLQMPLESGLSIMPALAFTAERLHGAVAVETRIMLGKMRARPGSEGEEFDEAAARLGTEEARAFFTALKQAHLEGGRVIRSLAAQAEALRVSSYQKSREENKKLPVKLVLKFALHLLPLLYIVALLPTLLSLGHLS